MPAARLTHTANPVADAVRAVLAGRDLPSAAAGAGLDPDGLADAIDAYHAAGSAALEQLAAARWHQVRVRPAGRDSPERMLATVIGPRLDSLLASGAAAGWWFMRKPPGWRLRFAGASTPLIGRLLSELAEDGTIAAWNPAVYEPEEFAFGGPAGIAAAHALFCADTRGVLGYLRRENPSPGRRELSVLLVSAMLGAAGLDWYERGDVFARLAWMRPGPPPGTTAQAEQLAAQTRALLSVPARDGSPLFAPGGPAAFAAPWRAAFETAGRAFGDAAASGSLARGLRAVLAHAVIFHWNRLGLRASAQASLARAAASACLPGD